MEESVPNGFKQSESTMVELSTRKKSVEGLAATLVAYSNHTKRALGLGADKRSIGGAGRAGSY